MSAPMTPEEVREARRGVDVALRESMGTNPLARLARELERHAEAMAEAIGGARVTTVPRDIAMAFAEYRTQFPRTDEDGR